MNVEYEEFDNVEDMFMYLASVAPPMKNTEEDRNFYFSKEALLTN